MCFRGGFGPALLPSSQSVRTGQWEHDKDDVTSVGDLRRFHWGSFEAMVQFSADAMKI